MANELEQKARALLAAEVAASGRRVSARAIRHGDLPEIETGEALRAIVAALQQAQQPGTLCEDCPPAGYPTDVTRCDPCPRKQQQGAQAVAWPSGLLDRVKAAEQRIENGHAPRRIPADPSDVDLVLAEVRCLLEGSAPPFWLKSEATAPPPLPEGVSEEDVNVGEATWMRVCVEEDRPARDAVRAIIEQYRARLAAKGGV